MQRYIPAVMFSHDSQLRSEGESLYIKFPGERTVVLCLL